MRSPILLALLIAVTMSQTFSDCFADEAAAQSEFAKINAWRDAEQPKSGKSAIKTFQATLVKKLEAHIKAHPNFAQRVEVERLLGDTLIATRKLSKAKKLYEEMAAVDGARGVLGRVGYLRVLCLKRQLSAARKQLDEWMLKFPEENSLLEFDRFLIENDTKRKSTEKAFRKLKRGQKFSGFRSSLFGGGSFDLSQNKGKKATLVGFYVPFIEDKVAKIGRPELEMANQLFSEYGERGLVVVGVPFFKDADRLRKLLEQLQLKWPQLRSGPTLHKVIGPTPLPQWVLLDADGKILAKGLRGAKLKAAVDSVFGKSAG